jgi:hypothetical protein
MGRMPKTLDPKLIVELHLMGKTVTKIAKTFGVHNERIKEVLNSEGIPIRAGAWGENHPRWNGGRFVDKFGYVQVTLSRDDPLRCMVKKTGTVREHRLVMARHLNRPLKGDETVHHLDGNPQNNELSNLQLRHGPHGEGIVLICRSCGSHDIEKSEI